MGTRFEQDSTRYVVVISVLLGVSFGVAFAPEGSNQLVYVARGLRLLDPNFLRVDWWAAETTGYHPAFSYLVAGLEYLGLLPWSLAIANIVLVAATGWITYELIRMFDQRRPFTVWLVFLVLFIGVVGGRSVAGSYLYDESLQASTISTFATVAAILLFVQNRILYSGLLLAVAGLFHANFLVLGFPVFGIAHLLLRKPGLIRRSLLQLTPLALVLAVDLPMILDVSGLDLPANFRAEANRLIIEVAAPYHYQPRSFLTEFFPLVGWQIAAVSVLGMLPGDPWPRRNFVAIYLALLSVVGIGTILTTVVSIDAVARLFVWRMAPFLEMCAHIAIALAVVRLFCEDPAEVRAFCTRGRSIGFGLGTAMVLAFFLRRMPAYDPRLWVSLVGAGALAVAWLRVRYNRPMRVAVLSSRGMPVMLAFALMVTRVPAFLTDSDGTLALSPKFNLIYMSEADRARMELYRWARTTPQESRFLIPPVLSGFRLHARRAVVVDWKGRPFRPNELLEWHRRIIATSGLARWRRLDELDLAYDRRSDMEILNVVRSYKVDFIVLDRRAGVHPAFGRPVFENTLFRVYRAPAALWRRTRQRNAS